MRVKVDVAADKSEMPWKDVHGAARGVMYALLGSRDSELSSSLHDGGWSGHPVKPVGISPPLFAGTKAKKGAYTTSSQGLVEMGSPVPQLAGCLLGALAERTTLRWGPVSLAIKGVQLGPDPDHSAGSAVFETVSPILIKHESRYLLPQDELFADLLVHNIKHRADVLGLPTGTQVEVLEAGPRRRYVVGRGFRIGATAKLRVEADPTLLDALYEGGLGLSCVEGFGWVR